MDKPSEYIDRAKLLKYIRGMQYMNFVAAMVKEDICDVIAHYMGADVDIVNCKECKFNMEPNAIFDYPHCSRRHNSQTTEDGFCDLGKRKDEVAE